MATIAEKLGHIRDDVHAIKTTLGNGVTASLDSTVRDVKYVNEELESMTGNPILIDTDVEGLMRAIDMGMKGYRAVNELDYTPAEVQKCKELFRILGGTA